jgi:hypothetical protein
MKWATLAKLTVIKNHPDNGVPTGTIARCDG